MKLEKTKDYGKFIHNHEQRPIDRLHAKRIAENMQQVGFIPSKPIQCYKKGTKLVVVDGHHRLKAAESIGLEVFYVVEAELSQQTMASENMLVKKWVYLDFARLYAARGNKDYIKLMHYVEAGIPCSMASSLLHGEGAASCNVRANLANGKFKVVTTEDIDRIVWLMNKFGEKSPAVKIRAFISAISKCLMCDDFDFDVFVSRMEANPHMMEKASNEDQMLSVIEGIYNFRSRTPIPLKHKVVESSKSRKINFGK